MPNRRVELNNTDWVQVTKDTTSIFRVVNQSNSRLVWIVDTALPSTIDEKKDAQARSVQLQPDESMSRFDEMAGMHLYMKGGSTRGDGDFVVVID